MEIRNLSENLQLSACKGSIPEGTGLSLTYCENLIISGNIHHGCARRSERDILDDKNPLCMFRANMSHVLDDKLPLYMPRTDMIHDGDNRNMRLDNIRKPDNRNKSIRNKGIRSSLNSRMQGRYRGNRTGYRYQN